MTELPELEHQERIAVFRRALDDCHELYERAGRECARLYPQSLPMPAEEFIGLMLDLQRGLVVKVFVEIAQSDMHWSAGERELAVELIDHVWGRRLLNDEVRPALEELVAKAGTLDWGHLFNPFETLPYLKDRVAELETVVTRIANLVAKFDDRVGPQEIARIRYIQDQLRRHLVPLRLDDDVSPSEGKAAQQSAMQKISAAGEEIRRDYGPAEGLSAAPVEKTREELLDAALGELRELIGVESIKRDVQELTDFLKIQDERAAHGLPRTSVSLHMIFCGNPGTGKTTVARIVGRIFGALGILKRGHLVETDRSGLVAGYTGQTGPKVNQKVDEALDGVLFIDEAYSLAPEESDNFAAEAVQTLLRRMEDDRARLVVILAGYSEPMDHLLSSNAGLASRFRRRMVFQDYTAAELGRIFERMCQQQHYTLPPATRWKLLLGFEHLRKHRNERFGNGRLARNIFEAAIRRLATRIVTVKQLTKELLTNLEPADIAMEGVSDKVWQNSKAQVAITCPGCQQVSKIGPELFGRTVRCNRCRERFLADWGDVV